MRLRLSYVHGLALLLLSELCLLEVKGGMYRHSPAEGGQMSGLGTRRHLRKLDTNGHPAHVLIGRVVGDQGLPRVLLLLQDMESLLLLHLLLHCRVVCGI